MEALQEIRTLARQFAEEQLRPHVEHWDHSRELGGDTVAQLAELGFFGMRIPERYGGMEFDLPTLTAALEELAWGEPAIALIVARNNLVAELLLEHGDEEQKRRWLEPMAAGEVVACTAFPEGVGSDPPVITDDADGWRLRGTLPFVVNGGAAQVVLAAARAAEDAPAVLFLVATKADGWSAAQRHTTMGFRALTIIEARLDDVRVVPDARIAPDSRLANVATGTDADRLSIAAIALGIAQAALDHAVAYADQREQFGRKLRSFEGIQLKLADMSTRVHAARALIVAAATSPTPTATATAKLFASEAAMWVATQAVQIFGGYGYMRDYPVEKLMRDAKGTEILGGENERLRKLIARKLYEG